MSSQIINDEITTTHRRTFITLPPTDAEHQELLRQGFHKDRYNNQYRKIEKKQVFFVDGVQMTPEEFALALAKAEQPHKKAA